MRWQLMSPGLAPDDIPLLKVDNSEVLRRQLEKLAQLRAERDSAEVDRRLAALTEGAARDGNLLALSVEAAAFVFASVVWRGAELVALQV